MIMKTTKIVSYTRVSTSKQGLSLVAQQNLINDYISNNPQLQVIGQFSETFSGKDSNRPEFKKAWELCERSGATLLVAKLDRLGRGRFLYTIMGNNKVNFIALDINGTSELEKTIRCGIAIDERKTISARTSSGLQAKAQLLQQAGVAYKAGDIATAQQYIELAELKSRVKRGLDWWVGRGFRLGSVHKLSESEKEQQAINRVNEANADEANNNASKAIADYLKQGNALNYSAIANYLNDNNYKTRRGKGGWKPQSVKNLIQRFNIV